MLLLSRTVGPLQTNVHLLADEQTGEAIAIDTATPSLAWLSGELSARRWRLRLIVSTHGHWDHIGDNAAVQAWTREDAEPPGHGADIAVHPLDRDRLVHPSAMYAPFDIVPSIPAVELAEGGTVRFGSIRLEVLHTPGHTEGSVCLLAADDRLLFTGDTLFASGWGRTDLPGGSPEQMVESLTRLSRFDDGLRVLPGHGPATSIGRERQLLELIASEGRLPA